MKDLNITMKENGSEITVLQGQTLPLQPPNKIRIEGDIKTVSNFLKIRKDKGIGLQEIDPAEAIIMVDKSELTIELQLHPENHYGAVVKGTLELSDELKQFCINKNTKFSRQELVKLIKMNKIYFDSKDKHAETLIAFQKIDSSVNYSAKDGSDDRGNKERTFIKNVETNAPMNFTLFIPVFKGFQSEHLSVEICLDIEEGTAKFWLESVQLNELLQLSVDEIFAEELKVAEGFVIINK
jgi:hypothetical protein